MKKNSNNNHNDAESKLEDYLRGIASSEDEMRENEESSESESNLKIIPKKVKKITVTDAHLASFRGVLLLTFYHCKDKGYCTTLDFQIFNEIYDYYISLGGNGLIKALKSKFDEIPLEDEYINKKDSDK